MSVSGENTGEVVYGPTILEEAESGVPSPSPCTAEIQEETDLQENVDPEEVDKTGTTLKLDMQNGNGSEDSEANQDGVSLVGYVPSESDESDIDNMLTVHWRLFWRRDHVTETHCQPVRNQS